MTSLKRTRRKKIKTKNRISKIIIFGLLALALGAFGGAIVCLLLKIMNLGITLLWEIIPAVSGLSGWLYNLIVCLAGGLLIALWQKRYGLLPDNMEQVMGSIKKNGTYPYNNLHIVSIAALLPLIFGGALGPEAGLTGIIVGICCFIGDNLKYRGEEVRALMECGITATLGIIFNAPFFGIAAVLEPDPDENETYKKKLVSKKARIYIYIMGVSGGLLAMLGISSILGSSGGLPRFEAYHTFDISAWIWFIPLVAAGLTLSIIYSAIHKFTDFIGSKLINRRIISCLLAGVILAIVGAWQPLAMFSGESQLEILISNWESMTVVTLLVVAVCKIFLLNFCIDLGWRGGNIFPLIFASVSAGYGLALLMGIGGTFAVAAVAAAMYGHISRKPVMAVCVLLLCFPVTYIIPLVIAAIIGAKVPVIKPLIVNQKKTIGDNHER